MSASHEVAVEHLPAVADDTGSLVLRGALMQALRELPIRQRSVLVLRYFLGSEILVSARGFDIKATGDYHDLTPVTVDQLVRIVNSIRGL